jgi:hypothetical protein
MIAKRNVFYFIMLLSTLFMINSCNSNTFPPYPPTSAGIVRFGEPSSFACYTKHNGTQKIKLWVSLRCNIYDRNQRVEFSTATMTIDPSISNFPVDINLGLPSTGRFEVEATVHGVDCSECANGASAPDETPYANCAYFVNNTTPPTTRAAKPRWNGTVSYSSYQSVLNFGALPRILNVPNSCGCNVSW